jgi:hypothetical protein
MTQTPITISQLPDLGSVQGSDRLVLDRIGAAVTAGAFVVGQSYQIISVGNTSFTAIGAESNTVGAYFVATGAGTGTGTAGPINTGDAPLSAVATLLGGDPAGTAAAAVAAHAAAADSHPGYTTPQEAAAVAPVQSVALSVPSGWTTSSTNTGGGVTLTLGLPSGFSLPSNATQATWTTGAALAGTAVQEGDIRLTDSREWSAATVSQSAAEAGTSTTRVAYNPLRMFQGIAAWWAASEFKAKLDGIAASATANATDAQLRDRSSHTGTQALSTISGLGTGIPTALAINVGTVGAPVILAAQSANLVWAGPTTGTAAAPAFRSLVAGDIPTIPAGQVSGLGTLASQNGTFSGTSSGTNTGDQDLSGLAARANNLSDLTNAATARSNLGAAGSGAIGSSGLTMATNRLAGRSTAGDGPVEELSTSGGLVLVGGFLVPGEIVKLVVSDIGQTEITTGNFKSEARIDRAFVVVGITWNCHPTAMGSASTSDARPYIRTSAGTTSVGTKTNLLTTANNIASLAASVHTVNATSSISGGTYSGSAGDWLGVDLMSLGTGSSGHTLTYVLRYS